MRLEVYSMTDAAELRRHFAASSGEAEVFLRDDEKGALVLSADTGSPHDAANSQARTMRRLFDSGRFGNQGGDWLFSVGLWTPQDFREEFVAWYKEEHLPILLKCPLWDGCRFLEEEVASECQFYALHQLSDRQALQSPERKLSRSTPWFNRLAKNDWFDGKFVRTLYRRMS